MFPMVVLVQMLVDMVMVEQEDIPGGHNGGGWKRWYRN